MGGGGLSIGLAQLSSSHSERNVLSLCGYNLFSLGMTCQGLDLAQSCSSKALSRNMLNYPVSLGAKSPPPPHPFSSPPSVLLLPLEESLRLVLRRLPSPGSLASASPSPASTCYPMPPPLGGHGRTCGPPRGRQTKAWPGVRGKEGVPPGRVLGYLPKASGRIGGL